MEKGLRPANENPWYVLMTLHGEQEGEFSQALHDKNRMSWNVWAAHASPSKAERARARIADLPSPDVWHREGAEIRTSFDTAFRERNPHATIERCPEPIDHQIIEMEGLLLRNPLVLDGFFLPCRYRGHGSLFQDYVSMDRLFATESVAIHNASFQNEVHLTGAKIEGGVSLSVSSFERGLFASGMTCDSCTLDNAKLTGNLQLIGLDCLGDLSLSGFLQSSDNPGDLLAIHAKVGGFTVLTDAHFFGMTNFNVARLAGDLIAPRAVFGKGVDFGGAQFGDEVNFSGATFAKSVKFHQSTFRGRAHFEDARFLAGSDDVVSFSDAAFEAPTSFRDATFQNTYPDFEGTVLHNSSNFTPDTPDSPLWPDAKAKLDEKNAKQAKASCAVIRHALGKQGLPEAEHFFFRREMGFAAQIGGWWQRLPYRLFGALSDYGYSIQRPAMALLISWGVFAVVIHALCQWAALFPAADATSQAFAEDYHPFQSFALSFSNLFNFLGFQKTWFPATFLEGLPATVRVLSAAETIWGGLLLFLLLLGFRTRFRMR